MELHPSLVDPNPSFADLYAATYVRIYRYAYRHTGNAADAEDLTAVIYESALRAYPRFEPQGRPVLAWLYTIASRRAADFHRRRRSAAPLEAEASLADGAPGPADAAEQAWELAELQGALQRLSPADRQSIDLHFFAGLTHGETAALLNVTANAATVRLHRALRRLAREMEGVRHA